MAKTTKRARGARTTTAEARPISPLVTAANPPDSPEPRFRAERPAAAGEGVTVKSAAAAHTVVYIHGIANKPPASVLKCQWDTALFGAPIGDRSRMAYWVDRAFYPVPHPDTCAGADVVHVEDDEASSRAILALAQGERATPGLTLERELDALTDDPARRALLQAMAERIRSQADAADARPEAALTPGEVQAKIAFFLPPALRRLLTEAVSRAFLRDVNDFLFNEARREVMRRSLLDRLEVGGGPFIVVAHSQGSMIAYDVLRQLTRAQAEVKLFLTLGSPLGMQEVQDVFRLWTGGRLPFPPCVDRWVNVADPLDGVAFDKTLDDDFEGTIEDVRELNQERQKDPHSATGYLKSGAARNAVRQAVGAERSQPLARFVIAKDLVGDLEDAQAEARHPVLVQLVDDGPRPFAERKALDEAGDAVEAALREAVGDAPAEIERLRHFVSARLTRSEVERLRTRHQDLRIQGVWRNAAKRALIAQSAHTVQVRPANLGYGADGRNITWAVLDTGVRADHPHFALPDGKSLVQAQWDCTGANGSTPLTPLSPGFADLDKHGHGTHVAGVIAGGRPDLDMTGMAPRCGLLGFKVLEDDGSGRDSYIIKALDVIAGLNEAAGQLVVHGVNLSLGGNFDPDVFGCGHTPLCQELRRLWRQGVLVCLAAGNEGFAELLTGGGTVRANMDLSIGDPANLEEAIAVGSVHKTNPHTYGISFFSSRGPTADGRRKPDVVAPGERVLSARHDFRAPADGASPSVDDFYVEMSGTSMATPHVSGLLAAFLSLRREFIGHPDRVKAMLLDSCIDLKRDPYMQGAGLPNLMKMLALN